MEKTNNIDGKRVRKCGTMQYHEQLVQNNPENYIENRKDIERLTSIHIKQTSRAGLRRGIGTICCVVHVVYNTSEQNISDEQIYSQFEVLNRCYRNLDSDAQNVPTPFQPLRADAQIEFVLAKRDQNGKPTNGITRTKTNTDHFIDDNNVKFSNKGGIDTWSSDKYLNIWVCNLGGGLLGYAQFPGGPRQTDGVVINHVGFGTIGTATDPFNGGKSAVHEIGHWLNLLHIWGDDNGGCDGSDNVDDTPNCANMNFGKPTFPTITCENGPTGDMFMNYMDYTDDSAMYMFTPGQVKRMDAAINGPRASILLSDGLKSPIIKDFADEAKRFHKTTKVFNGVEWVHRDKIEYIPEGF
jgi:hypothetical protein